MRPLIIGPAETAAIGEAIERAKMHPVRLADVHAAAFTAQDKPRLKLSDRTPEFERSEASENVLLPIGYRAAISFEQQPAGLCRHLSVSVDSKGKLPSVEAMKMLAEAFGFRPWTPDTVRIWLEEFDPGHEAVNIVQLEATEGPL